MIPLREKLAKVEATEAEQRRRAQAIFPMTVTDLLAIRDKVHQLHICQFLMLEDTIRDKGELTNARDAIMTKYQWAWRQVTPLCEEYVKNVSTQISDERTGRAYHGRSLGGLEEGRTGNGEKHPSTCSGPTGLIRLAMPFIQPDATSDL